jgi:hypothetical protein
MQKFIIYYFHYTYVHKWLYIHKVCPIDYEIRVDVRALDESFDQACSVVITNYVPKVKILPKSDLHQINTKVKYNIHSVLPT